jgi:hypothetical protein
MPSNRERATQVQGYRFEEFVASFNKTASRHRNGGSLVVSTLLCGAAPRSLVCEQRRTRRGHQRGYSRAHRGENDYVGWLRAVALFEMTAHEQCPPEAAKHFIMLARRIAESLEFGLVGGVARSELVAAVTVAFAFSAWSASLSL